MGLSCRALSFLGIGVASAGCSLDYDGFSISPGPDGSGGASSMTGGANAGGAGARSGEGGTGVAGGTGGVGTVGGSGSAGGVGSMGGSGGVGPVGGSGGAGGAVPLDCGTLSYAAVVSDCVNPSAPNADTCQAEAGPGVMIYDTNYADGGGGPRIIYVRFDLDGAFQAAAVTSMTLRFTAPGYANADSGSTGEIWQVGAFARSDLFDVGTLPADQGGSAIAGALGPLAPSMVVNWTLPTSLAVPAASVYLRVEPLDGDVGHYFDRDGAAPPELVVSCE